MPSESLSGRLRRSNQRAERGCAGAARIERQALALLCEPLVESAERNPGFS